MEVANVKEKFSQKLYFEAVDELAELGKLDLLLELVDAQNFFKIALYLFECRLFECAFAVLVHGYRKTDTPSYLSEHIPVMFRLASVHGCSIEEVVGLPPFTENNLVRQAAELILPHYFPAHSCAKLVDPVAVFEWVVGQFQLSSENPLFRFFPEKGSQPASEEEETAEASEVLRQALCCVGMANTKFALDGQELAPEDLADNHLSALLTLLEDRFSQTQLVANLVAFSLVFAQRTSLVPHMLAFCGSEKSHVRASALLAAAFLSHPILFPRTFAFAADTQTIATFLLAELAAHAPFLAGSANPDPSQSATVFLLLDALSFLSPELLVRFLPDAANLFDFSPFCVFSSQSTAATERAADHSADPVVWEFRAKFLLSLARVFCVLPANSPQVAVLKSVCKVVAKACEPLALSAVLFPLQRVLFLLFFRHWQVPEPLVSVARKEQKVLTTAGEALALASSFCGSGSTALAELLLTSITHHLSVFKNQPELSPKGKKRKLPAPEPKIAETCVFALALLGCSPDKSTRKLFSRLVYRVCTEKGVDRGVLGVALALLNLSSPQPALLDLLADAAVSGVTETAVPAVVALAMFSLGSRNTRAAEYLQQAQQNARDPRTVFLAALCRGLVQTGGGLFSAAGDYTDSACVREAALFLLSSFGFVEGRAPSVSEALYLPKCFVPKWVVAVDSLGRLRNDVRVRVGKQTGDLGSEHLSGGVVVKTPVVKTPEEDVELVDERLLVGQTCKTDRYLKIHTNVFLVDESKL